MAKQKWQQEHKWELNKEQKKFEKRILELGFSIIGVRDYVSKDEWLIEKDGTTIECSVPSTNDCNGEKLADLYAESHKMKKELEALTLASK